MERKTKLSVGDWVEVRSKEEILRTLDANGQLDRAAVYARDVPILRGAIPGLQRGTQDL
jgi:hypothetical protein